MCGVYDLDGPDEAGKCRARLWLEGQEEPGGRAVLSWRGLRAMSDGEGLLVGGKELRPRGRKGSPQSTPRRPNVLGNRVHFGEDGGWGGSLSEAGAGMESSAHGGQSAREGEAEAIDI